MAMPNDDTNLVPRLHIKAVQSVLPSTTTDPRPRRQVSVTDPIGSGIFQRSLNVILYYKKATEEDSGWSVAGWIKESLATAMSQQSIFAGRLRRGEDGHGELEIVANDSGGRLLEAQISMTLQEFLDSKDEEVVEAELVFWKDIDEQNPQFCPLFYVQVTNFECGGYSIGISCSILLADLLFMDNFLKSWTNIHNNLMSKNEVTKEPIFYFPNHKKAKSIPSSLISSNQRKNCGQTMIFKIATEDVNFEKESCKALALLSIEKAKLKIGSKMAMEFSMFVKESSEVIKVESCVKHALVNSKISHEYQLSSASWDELGELAFPERNKPSHVSYWIGSICDGIVMAFPSSVKGTTEMNIIVTIPNEKQM